MRRIAPLLLLALLLASCAAGPDPNAGTANAHGHVAGFWFGLWHGLIAPITFVISIFSREVGIYEVHNNGAWYDFGFLFGASVFFGGSGGGAARRRR